MRCRLTAAVATVALTALSLAAYDGFTIKKNPKAGDVHRYKQAGRFVMPGQTLDFEAIATDKISTVESNGNYSIEETLSGFKINGKETAEGNSTTTTTYNPKGEIVGLKADMVSSSMYRLANMAIFIMPDHDVRVGDTWTYDIKPDVKNNVPSGTAKYTLLGEEKVAGIDALKIKFAIKESGSDPAGTDGSVWLGKADGTLLKMTTKWSNVPVQTQVGEISITGDISLTLLP